ncbi:hypothetical protein [Endozoicomonas sp. ALD040]|uniref:hypothetical protein n=1 Tax=Endozoicomonas sp. ALD040 TaxID=3403079 RepID=UPI003BB01559
MASFSLNPKVVEENISRIEHEFNVKNIRFNGWYVWNAVKCLLAGLHLWSFDSAGLLASANRKTYSVFNSDSSFRQNKLFAKEVGDNLLLAKEKPCLNNNYEIVFLEALDSLVLNERGSSENRLFKPFQDEMSEFTQLSILPFDNGFRKIQFERDILYYKKPIDKYIPNNFKERNIRGLKELFFFIRKNKLLCPFSYDYVDRWIKSIFIRSDNFINILSNISPKLLMLTSFYSSERLAAVIACKKLGIKTVEVQHGILGPNFYNLKKIDHQKDILPDTFWVWGESSRKYIKPVKDDLTPEVLVGGKLDLFSYKNGSNKEGKKIKNIVFIEQYTHNHTKSMITKAANTIIDNNLQDKFQISLRLHPRSHHLIEKYTDYFSSYSFFDIQETTSKNIYELLNQAYAVVVESSTVAYEASFFGCKVLAYGENAKEYFSEAISNKLFHHIDDYKKTVEYIVNMPEMASDEDNHFFVNCKGQSDYNLNKLKEYII